ncbi:MAG: CAP domain-containing protein [Planctomycetota bacterium]|nr:CAP domain-containing protein [Planctomycetota bacterium]
MSRFWILFAAMVTLCAPLSADVVYLSNGGVVVGEVAERNDEYIVVITAKGVKTILQTHEIEKIEVGTLEEIYWRRLKSLDKDDAESHYQLGLWCEKVKMSDYAREEFEKSVILDPNHFEARKKLGFKFTREEGWTKNGEDIPYQEETLRPSEKLDNTQNELVKRILDNSLDPFSLGASEREETIKALKASLSTDTVTLKNLRKEILLRTGIESDSNEQMLKRWNDLWEEARLSALKEVYLSEGEEKLSSSDRTLEVYKYYAILLKRKLRPIKTISTENAKELILQFRQLSQRIEKILSILSKLEGKTGESTTQLPPRSDEDSFTCAYGLLLYKAGFREDGWEIAKKTSGWRFRVFLLLVSEVILSANKEVMKQLSPEEQSLCEKINDYRMALGRMPLELDLRLCKAAKSHSFEMEKMGYFGHISPVKEHSTPNRRALVAAYEADLVGENLFKGKDASEALDAWRQSEPHHKQLLAGWDALFLKDEKQMLPLLFMPWRTFGVGCSSFAVVMFGPLSSLKGAVPSLDEKLFRSSHCGKK